MPVATITRFPKADVTQGKRFVLGWDRLFERLCRPTEARSKMDLPLWSPAIWPHDNRSEGVEPVEVCALVLDIDHGATLSGGLGAIEGGPMACLHTSWRHQRDVEVKTKINGEVITKTVCEDRFRMVFPLSVSVVSTRYGLVWRSAERWMREKHGLVIDGQVKNAGRSWFIPARAPGFPFEAHRNEGAMLDPWELVERWPTVRAVPPPPPPAPVRHGERALQLKRASAYLRRMPESIAGQDGHAALWNAALTLVKGFSLSADEALSMLASEFNPRCDPPWNEKELSHKVRSAMQAATPSGFVRNRDKRST